jgi:hypothetical protein
VIQKKQLNTDVVKTSEKVSNSEAHEKVKFYLDDSQDTQKPTEIQISESSSEPSEDEDNEIVKRLENQLEKCNLLAMHY